MVAAVHRSGRMVPAAPRCRISRSSARPSRRCSSPSRPRSRGRASCAWRRKKSSTSAPIARAGRASRAAKAPSVTPATPRGGRGVKVSEEEEESEKEPKKAKGGKLFPAAGAAPMAGAARRWRNSRNTPMPTCSSARSAWRPRPGTASNFDSHLKRHDRGPAPAGQDASCRRASRWQIEEPITVRSLSAALGLKTNEIISKLMRQGVFATAEPGPERDDGPGTGPGVGHRTAGSRQQATPEELLMAEFENRPAGREEPRVAPAGGHDPGPRRPRQDQPAGQDPQRQRGGGRGRRHHAAHRGVDGRSRRRRGEEARHLHRHARPPGVHRHACPRREHDRRGRAGGLGGRRRAAADDRVDQPREGGRRAASSWR